MASAEEEMERGKALMAGNTLVWRFCAYGFLKNLQVGLIQAVIHPIVSDRTWR
jgi:hypothetical protein